MITLKETADKCHGLVAQWVKCLPCKHEDLSSDSQNPCLSLMWYPVLPWRHGRQRQETPWNSWATAPPRAAMFSGCHAAQVRSQKGRCSAYKHPDHPLRKVNPQKDSLTASSDGTPAGVTELPPHTDSITLYCTSVP